MEQILWAKTILRAYAYIEKIITMYDDSFNKLSLMPELTATEVTTKLIDLTDRKVKLINLKLIVEKVLASCKPKHIRLLYLKYVQNKKAPEIAEIIKSSRRTVFRNIRLALDEFSQNMVEFGYCSNYLYKNLKNEKWILNTYAKEYLKLQIQEDKKDNKKETEFEEVSAFDVVFNQFRRSLF